MLRAPRPEVVLVLSRPTLDCSDTRLDDSLSTCRVSASVSQSGDDREASDCQVATDKTYKTITAVLPKEGASLGFILEGGKDSPLGDRPLVVKKMFKGTANLASTGTHSYPD